MVNQKKQQGIVLITAMIMTIAVTAVAVSLMSSSSIDLKISNAAQERAQAESMLLGEISQMLGEHISTANNPFTLERQQIPEQGFDMTPTWAQDMTNTLTSSNNGESLLECPRKNAADDEGVKCIYTELVSTIEYGTKYRHSIEVVMGMAQEVIDYSGGN